MATGSLRKLFPENMWPTLLTTEKKSQWTISRYAITKLLHDFNCNQSVICNTGNKFVKSLFIGALRAAFRLGSNQWRKHSS